MLMEGAQNGSNKVTKDELDTWTGMFHQNYPSVMGDGKIHQKIWQGWGPSIGLPFNLIIDRETMVIKGLMKSAGLQGAIDLCNAP